ncbi:MAG: dienelactone hydrolase family protein [Proteobacteria bacterium]|nr:dienelactone hydrolase family protein [Pseudomonadota bacterium]
MKLVSFLTALVFSLSTFAATETVIEYKDSKTVLEGVLFTPEKVDKALPAVIVVHEWMGLNDSAKKARADKRSFEAMSDFIKEVTQ